MLKKYRHEIDDIDNKIADLLDERFDIVNKIGMHKRLKKISVIDPKRQQDIILRVTKDKKYPKNIKDIYEHIFENSQKLENMTLALIGKNIGHSLSPVLHKCIASDNNIGIEYVLLDIFENEIAKYLEMLKNGVFNGFNVTTPYKEIVVKYLDRLEGIASEIGVVNTVIYKDNELVGYNTDYKGFLDLWERKKVSFQEKIYVLGTGGAAKTVAKALADCNTVLVSRNKKGFLHYNDIPDEALIINATPKEYQAKEKQTVVDLKYIGNEDGLYMLIRQALYSERIFNDNSDLQIDDNKIMEVLRNVK